MLLRIPYLFVSHFVQKKKEEKSYCVNACDDVEEVYDSSDDDHGDVGGGISMLKKKKRPKALGNGKKLDKTSKKIKGGSSAAIQSVAQASDPGRLTFETSSPHPDQQKHSHRRSPTASPKCR